MGGSVSLPDNEVYEDLDAFTPCLLISGLVFLVLFSVQSGGTLQLAYRG